MVLIHIEMVMYLEKEINKILADPNGPYWNKKHPNHESAVKEVFQLQNMKLGIESE